MTTLDVSAQFGGRDAAKALLPHYWALKAAMKGKALRSKPFGRLAFILRVDGAVSQYELSGVGSLEKDRSGDYWAIEVGITRDRWVGQGAEIVAAFVADALVASVAVLRGDPGGLLKWNDLAEIDLLLRSVAAEYRSHWGG